MFELLTGLGLATSAGLNAYIPLLAIGLLSRYTDLMNLPQQWAWLENQWVIGLLGVLLAIEFVADKVPVVDHINDVIHTFIRPTSGGLAFGAASSSETVTVSDPAEFFSSNQWVPIAIGIAVSLGVHGMKAVARPIINTTTAGFGAPVASAAEDLTSVILSVVAIILPILVLVFIIGLIVMFVGLLRRRRRRKEAKRLQKAARDGQTQQLYQQQPYH